MNPDTQKLVEDVTGRIQRAIRAEDYPAIVGLHGDRTLFLSDYDYVCHRLCAVAFEHRAFTHAQKVTAVRWVFAVPQVWRYDGDLIEARPPFTGQVEPDEQETIIWMSYDSNDGVDYGRVLYARRPNGEPVFENPEYLRSAAQPMIDMPGYVLLRLLTEEQDDDSRDTDVAFPTQP
jgi:hypothetical protein